LKKDFNKIKGLLQNIQGPQNKQGAPLQQTRTIHTYNKEAQKNLYARENWDMYRDLTHLSYFASSVENPDP
jgi:hypothetical protein